MNGPAPEQRTPPAERTGRYVALCGGIGGAKLALGLSRRLRPDRLTLIVNSGDDFRHLGLHISPDIDTVLYTLAGLADPERGWGRAAESWAVVETLGQLGGETWFRLGDGDLALHLLRSERLAGGTRLTEVVADLCRRLSVGVQVLPPSDDPIRTVVETESGDLALQHYFVRARCKPAVRGLRYEGAETARPAPEALAALADTELRAVFLCPSNPYLSLGPMLALPGLRAALGGLAVPRVAVCPLVGGRAVKGPLDKMMQEMGIAPGPQAVIDFYAGLIDAMVIDDADRGLALSGTRIAVRPTLMRSLADREALADAVLDLAEEMAS